LESVGAPLPPNFGAAEFIVVQGAADLAAIFEKEIWLVDFKTDRLPPQLLAERVQEYSLQLRIYALALSRIYKRPVTRACLHFLDSGATEWVDRHQPGYLPLI
jgi:ATP-dependent helicase/nuclease subunit A